MFLRAPKTVDLKLISDNFFFSSSICFRSQEENACAPIRRLCWLAIEQTSCAIINWASFLMRSINYRILNVMRSAETEIRNTYGWSRVNAASSSFKQQLTLFWTKNEKALVSNSAAQILERKDLIHENTSVIIQWLVVLRTHVSVCLVVLFFAFIWWVVRKTLQKFQRKCPYFHHITLFTFSFIHEALVQYKYHTYVLGMYMAHH